jgi:hypothetical protein
MGRPRGYGSPVRRHSREAGRCEGTFWRPFNGKDSARYMLAAERFERMERQANKRNGPLGPVGLEVLRDLLRLVDYRTGRLEPAITTLMRRLKRSRDAICRALKALRRHGFLDWLRRWEPSENPGEAGPQVKQATNAYRLTLPPRAEKLLSLMERADAPMPEDREAELQARKAAFLAMVDALPLDEQPRAIDGDNPLTQALSRLGRGVMGRSVSPPSGQNPGPSSILLEKSERPNGRESIF